MLEEKVSKSKQRRLRAVRIKEHMWRLAGKGVQPRKGDPKVVKKKLYISWEGCSAHIGAQIKSFFGRNVLDGLLRAYQGA